MTNTTHTTDDGAPADTGTTPAILVEGDPAPADVDLDVAVLPDGARAWTHGFRLSRNRVFALASILVAPLLITWPLRSVLFAVPDMIDPYLHTAVIEHGRDLVERFGSGDRQFTRAGFTVPGAITYHLFGTLGGYYALRYLMVIAAIAPAFLLFKRLHSRGAGAVAVAALLANPVIVKAWSTDFPVSSAASYLVAACCCLVMPGRTPRARWGWLAAGGVFLGLTLYSHIVTVVLVACVIVVYAFARLRMGWKTVLREGAALAGAFVGTSLVLSLFTKILFGVADIWTPNWRAFTIMRSDAQTAVAHSTNWRWILDTPYLMVPVLVALTWILLALRPRNGFRTEERIIWWILVFQVAGYTFVQFFQKQWTLEFHYYSALLWPAATLVAVSALTELTRALLEDKRWAWVPAVVVFFTPLLVTMITRHASMSLVGALGLALLTAALVFVVSRRATPLRATAALVVFVLAAYLITIGQSPSAKYRAGQAVLPRPYYGQVFWNNDHVERDRYSVISDVHNLVPNPSHPGTPILVWAPTALSQTANLASAQYGWLPNMVQGLPNLTAAEVARIRAVNPDVLLLLGDNDLQPAIAHLHQAFPGSTVHACDDLHRGSISLDACVVNLHR